MRKGTVTRIVGFRNGESQAHFKGIKLRVAEGRFLIPPEGAALACRTASPTISRDRGRPLKEKMSNS